MRHACLCLMWLSLLPLSARAIDVDGRIQTEEWAGARHITDFRQVQPLTGKPATLRFNIDNLTNEKYWLPSWGFILVQGAPRTFRASATAYF